MLFLTAALTHAIALDNNIGLIHDHDRVSNRNASSSRDYEEMQPKEFKEHQGEDALTPQSSSSGSSFSSTLVIVISLGFLILLGLALLLVVLRRGRNDEDTSDYEGNQSLENSRLCIKRTTFTVPEVAQAYINELESSGSVIPVLSINANHCKLENGPLLELKPSWADASAATTMYRVAPANNAGPKPKVPMLIYTTNEREWNESRLISDNGSHTDDYSIDILESPVSLAYSFESEDGDVFSSTRSEGADSYWSLHDTSLSTSSHQDQGNFLEYYNDDAQRQNRWFSRRMKAIP
ncbi:hypothetical protein PsorP6_005357 [Peronosclerospora sorghi]|uniref:Uncharacterized protein n=1 Tax=Peronosclerospora sorghi TaxID=230839 RepID=A0ACC0W3W0_9STRA|nr:hypothetical protein PsorP6_005357 [Peronosclerospora sorghi]